MGCWESFKKPRAKIFTIDEASSAFSSKFDEIQEQLEKLASLDDLLSGV